MKCNGEEDIHIIYVYRGYKNDFFFVFDGFLLNVRVQFSANECTKSIRLLLLFNTVFNNIFETIVLNYIVL